MGSRYLGFQDWTDQRMNLYHMRMQLDLPRRPSENSLIEDPARLKPGFRVQLSACGVRGFGLAKLLANPSYRSWPRFKSVSRNTRAVKTPIRLPGTAGCHCAGSTNHGSVLAGFFSGCEPYTPVKTHSLPAASRALKILGTHPSLSDQTPAPR